jgi:hypothetical protein
MASVQSPPSRKSTSMSNPLLTIGMDVAVGLYEEMNDE